MILKLKIEIDFEIESAQNIFIKYNFTNTFQAQSASNFSLF